jgi:hypothetical protein
MSATAVATKDTIAETPPVKPRVPAFAASDVTVDSRGFSRSRIFARAPEGMVFGDLGDPSVWKNLQAHSDKALRVWDEVFILSRDQSWFAEGVCVESTATTATLVGLKVTNVPPSHRRLPNDGKYVVRFTGLHYTIEEIATGRTVGDSFPTVETAERAMDRLHHKRVT